MDNQVPHEGLAIAAWAVLGLLSALLVRRAIVAFLLGLLSSAAFIGYCTYYQGPLEGLGIAHALAGAVLVVAMYYLGRWLRCGFQRTKTPTRENTMD